MRSVSRSLCVASLVVLVPTHLAAQSASHFGPGSKLVSLGVLTGGDNYDGTGGGGTFEIGILSLSKSVHLGIGGSLGYMRSTQGSSGFELSLSQIPAYGIGNLHYSPPSQPKLDLFAGASVGVTYSRVSGDVFADRVVPLVPESVALLTRARAAARRATESNTDTGFGIQGGAHYAVTNAMSVTAQIGLIDIPLFFGGVSFRF
jgi:opacity protein-like surface antigen